MRTELGYWGDWQSLDLQEEATRYLWRQNSIVIITLAFTQVVYWSIWWRSSDSKSTQYYKFCFCIFTDFNNAVFWWAVIISWISNSFNHFAKLFGTISTSPEFMVTVITSIIQFSFAFFLSCNILVSCSEFHPCLLRPKHPLKIF